MAQPKSRHEALIIVISVSVVAGMAIAILLLLCWNRNPLAFAGGAGLNAAVAICPPFMLVYIAREMDDTTLSRIIIGGAVVVANGSLYAGLAAFVMWTMTRVWPRGRGEHLEEKSKSSRTWN